MQIARSLTLKSVFRACVSANGARNLRFVSESDHAVSGVPALRWRESAQVRRTLQSQSFRDVSQPLSTGREKPAEEGAPSQSLQPGSPELGRGADAFEDLGDFTRNPRLALAEKPSAVIHQQQVAAQRESFGHPFTRGIKPAPVL